MTREELINAINENKDSWSCPEYSCDMPKLEDNSRECCLKCAEKQLKDYEDGIIAETIDKIYSEFEQVVKNDSRTSYYWTDLWVEFMKICEKLKGEQNDRNNEKYNK